MIMKPLFRIACSLSVIVLILIAPAAAQEQYTGVHADHKLQFGHLSYPQSATKMDKITRPVDLQVRTVTASQVVFGYHPYWNGTAWENYSYDLLTHIAWFDLSINSSGNITNTNGWPVTSLVTYAHDRGVKVVVTVTLFDSDAIAILLASASYRQNAINNLIAQVALGNADGVNIDFEFVPSGSRDNFNTFIYDLTQAFHDQIPGSEVSIAMPAVDWGCSDDLGRLDDCRYDYDFLSDNCDGLMIMAYGYYWKGSTNAGPISPLNAGFSSWYIQRTIDDYLAKTGGDGSQLILGLPWYGIDWPVTGTAEGSATTGYGSAIVYSNAEPNALTYGKNYSNTAPSAWYNYDDNGAHQVWYDDSSSLAEKYLYAQSKGIKGIGIWALGYDGNRAEFWGGLQAVFGTNSTPLPPEWFYVKNMGNGKILIQSAEVSSADIYEVYISTDNIDYSLWAESENPEIILENLSLGQPYYVRLKCRNAFGSSAFTETLGAVPADSLSQILIVQGFERITGTVNTFDYIKRHGPSILASGYAYDAVSNDAIASGRVNLNDYSMVDWISGEEATQTVSFDGNEQAAIMTYLEQGGRLLISGSEIGWDLEANGSTSDLTFYRNYFKADYVSDDAKSYSFYGSLNGIFDSMAVVNFDNGNFGSYDVDYPDGIKPYGGSVSNLLYSGTEYDAIGGAGIQYLGPFGASTNIGGIVYLGVGFEAIYPETARHEIMNRIIQYLDLPLKSMTPPVTVTGFQVSPAYPNPFNSSIKVPISVAEDSWLTIQIYDLKGRLIYSEEKYYATGDWEWEWDLSTNRKIAAGIYVLQLSDGHNGQTQPITYLK